MRQIELLIPARDPEAGRAAVDHGADAVYIGGPAFGARAAAGNSVPDIAALVDYSHRYRVKVYAALNTLVYVGELDRAEHLARGLLAAGVDALIIQDPAYLMMGLDGTVFHASTQMCNTGADRAKFLGRSGFSRVVLERGLTIDEIRDITARCGVETECFVHGAICVGHSGRCYLSRSMGPRSGNRGECSQPCRLAYDLVDGHGNVVVRDKHLLSVRDLNLSEYIGGMIDAGVTSFKVEGRLKETEYVKNVTAWYRTLLDAEIARRPGLRKSSDGNTQFGFTPDPAKTFSRGFTTWTAAGIRRGVASFDTPKALGEPLGRVAEVGEGWFTLSRPAQRGAERGGRDNLVPLPTARSEAGTGGGKENTASVTAAQSEAGGACGGGYGGGFESVTTTPSGGKEADTEYRGENTASVTTAPGEAESKGSGGGGNEPASGITALPEGNGPASSRYEEKTLSPGDGLCFLAGGRLTGTNINRVDGDRVYPNRPDGIVPDAEVYRNRDHRFLSVLGKSRAVRTVPVRIVCRVDSQNLHVSARDACGNGAETSLVGTAGPAANRERMASVIEAQMRKTGGTIYSVEGFTLTSADGDLPFVSAGGLNALRRRLLDGLTARRTEAFERDKRSAAVAAAAGRDDTAPYTEDHLGGEDNVANPLARRFWEMHGVTGFDTANDLRRSLDGLTVMTTPYCIRRELGLCLKEDPSDPIRELFLRRGRFRYRLEFDCAVCRMRLIKE